MGVGSQQRRHREALSDLEALTAASDGDVLANWPVVG